MDYKTYIRESKKGEARYIRSERTRYKKLERAFDRYRAAAHALGLHARNGTEIFDRFRELDQMLARIDETHGDTPGQRALFESRIWEAHRA